MNDFKPFFGFALSIGFLILSYYLTKQEDEIRIIIGYIGIIWWGFLLLFAIYKKFTTNKTTNKTIAKK